MIGYLKGNVKYKNAKKIILDISGVGYEVFLNEYVLQKIKKDSEVEFFIHTYVREDAIDLYGFETPAEKKFFELLISVSGVGPKSAQQTLSLAKVDEIKKAILRGDPSLLKRVSGIGTKTAERIVIELKNKLNDLPLGKNESVDFSSADDEVFDALTGLGYSNDEIRKALRKMPNEEISNEKKVKKALQIIGNKDN